jgi:hypothetical protein
MRPISVVLDARLITGEWGGVESVIIGLASGLSTLEDGDESYRFLTYAGKDDWLRPYLSGPCSALTVPEPPAWSDDRPVWRRIASRYVPSSVKSSARRLTGPKVSPPPASDGTIERLGADLMHFTFQNGFLTAVPSIYHPHDLQHLHLPDFFDPREYRRRELWYRTLCEQAAMNTGSPMLPSCAKWRIDSDSPLHSSSIRPRPGRTRTTLVWSKPWHPFVINTISLCRWSAPGR